jgi:hypothetical protein
MVHRSEEVTRWHVHRSHSAPLASSVTTTESVDAGILSARATHRPERRPDSWKAICQFRDYDGATRQLERAGTTKSKSAPALRAYIAERTGVEESGTLIAISRVEDAAKLYLDQTRRERSGTTMTVGRPGRQQSVQHRARLASGT